MHYLSTRGQDPARPFREAVMTGLARDGGLLIPESIPDVSDALPKLATLRYQDLAFEIMRLFADDIPEDDFRAIIEKSYSTFRHSEVTPLIKVGDIFILELFHGPTLAFKDVALQFLGNLFEYLLNASGSRLNILAATSGDTGSAAIHGVRGKKGISIFVLHPDGRVSPVQALQMTSVLDSNVHNLAISGTFDDCQGIVKTLFADLPFKDRHALGSMNSINWARVLAQTVYYFYAAFRAMERTGASQIDFTVPTGNFGDVFAGYIAAKMGLPIRKLVIATNQNDILDRCFKTGIYSQTGVVATLSPSMDIQIASNFERWLYYFYNQDAVKTASAMAHFKTNHSLQLTDGSVCDPWFASGRAGTEETLSAIRETWENNHYLLDPHTAVGVAVAKSRGIDQKVPMICLSTAHPAKFDAAVKRATGKALAHHPLVDALKGAPTRMDKLPADANAVAHFIEANDNLN